MCGVLLTHNEKLSRTEGIGLSALLSEFLNGGFMKSYWKAFWSGWLMCVTMRSLHQDILGKEQFMKYVDAAWVSGMWTIPIALMMLLVACLLFSAAVKDADR